MLLTDELTFKADRTSTVVTEPTFNALSVIRSITILILHKLIDQLLNTENYIFLVRLLSSFGSL